MSYQRLYPQRINWEDEPSLATPINQVNLNKMDSALYGIDGRVVELDENKVDKTETFNTTRNGVVPKPTPADITNEKVLRADGVWVEQSGGGGGGGGHTYVDKDDEQMPPRGKAKFTGGLNLTDDSENNRTIVDDNYEIIPWATWKEYSDAEKVEHPNAIITGAPDCDGTLEIEIMKLVWTNPTPNTAFPNQQIPLNTDGNYTHFRAKFKVFYTDTNYFWRDFKKGENVFIETNDIANLRLCRRGINSTSDTQLTIGSGVIRDTFTSSGQPVDDGRYVIPIEIYTYNKDLTAKIKAIAHDVSTDASKCMLDENTSVADVVGYGSVKVTANGVKTYSQLFNELFALVDMSRIKNSSVFVFDYQNSSGTKYQYLLQEISNIYLVFNRMSASSSGARIESFYLASTGSTNMQATGSTRNDISAQVPSSGWEFKIYY